ncbi:hypothetical protein BpHYR1_028328 [Brachionus plicatilis]|uniref:Uncharacterized protein n=1 Tax=Brachionus plicatilis TaxID=10195 RepID=A0A3M7R3K2_BRAPC|nr:hypothetical protein BpHYR1_028328 [Brachionus plicatilis]
MTRIGSLNATEQCLDDDLKRLSNSFPNLYNSDAAEKQPLPKKETKTRSKSANGSYENYDAQKPVKNHQSLKTLKQLKKKNEANNLNEKSRSKSSQPNFTNDLSKPKMEEPKPSVNLAKNKNSALSSLRLSKKLQGLKRQTKPCSESNTSNANSSIFTTSSILQNPRRRYDTSVGEKKAVRFADSLGLELENVITLNNQLDNQMKFMRLPKASQMYPPLIYADRAFVQNLPQANCGNKNECIRNQNVDNFTKANFQLIDFNDSKIENRYLNRANHVKVINYAEPRIYSNAPNYCHVYDDVNNYVPSNFVDVNKPINLYYSFNNENNLQKISITTRLNNGKLESEV